MRHTHDRAVLHSMMMLRAALREAARKRGLRPNGSAAAAAAAASAAAAAAAAIYYCNSNDGSNITITIETTICTAADAHS
jgi:hypothetical protein